MQEKRNSAIFLRARFQLELQQPPDYWLQRFTKQLRDASCVFKSRIVDYHLFIDIPEQKSTIWSPQLQLELLPSEEGTKLKGLFGPKPQLWTFFMFLHFVIGIAFLGFLTLLYTRIALEQSIVFPVCMIVALPLVWILLYAIGRIGRDVGTPQMKALHDFVIGVVDTLEA